MEANILGVAKQGHAAAWEKARAEMPELDINGLISIVASVWGAKENRAEAAADAAKKLAQKYKKPIEVYLNAFAVTFLADGLKQVKFQDISKLGTEEFTEKLVEAAKKIECAVVSFCHGNIDEVEFISRMGQTGVLEVGKSFLGAAGVDLDEVKGQIQGALGDVHSISIRLVSFCAAVAAYKILKGALQDAAMMREARVRVEAECARSIAQMRAYREEMSAAVSDYLYDHAETFNTGIAAMDRAILEGDVDGFLRGNVMIQEILNYKVKFRNQEEFDALMESDAVFVL